MENLNIKLDQFEGRELVVRTGDALPAKEPVKILINGNISAVSDFLSIRKDKGDGLQSVDLSRALVIVNKNNSTITLKLDPENPYGTEVMGKLELSDELKQFQINSTSTFTREQLVKLIRFNKIWFHDSEKHAGVLASYMAFNAAAYTDLAQASDARGNKENNLKKTVTTNVPTEFILVIPVFKGGQPERFRVEICLDVTDGGARFWFESVELHELIEKRKSEIFSNELESCNGFVIINQ